jgi:hypothetical protein
VILKIVRFLRQTLHQAHDWWVGPYVIKRGFAEHAVDAEECAFAKTSHADNHFNYFWQEKCGVHGRVGQRGSVVVGGRSAVRYTLNCASRLRHSTSPRDRSASSLA